MNVIKVESYFETAFDAIEQVSGQSKIWFGWGDQKELDRILLAKKKVKYPLLWYVMPNELKYQKGYANGTCKFFIAGNSNIDDFNDQRFTKVYNTLLFPYMENFFKAIQISKNISFTDDTYSWENIPNYTKQNKTGGVDYWDVISIKLDLTIKYDKNC